MSSETSVCDPMCVSLSEIEFLAETHIGKTRLHHVSNQNFPSNLQNPGRCPNVKPHNFRENYYNSILHTSNAIVCLCAFADSRNKLNRRTILSTDFCHNLRKITSLSWGKLMTIFMTLKIMR